MVNYTFISVSRPNYTDFAELCEWLQASEISQIVSFFFSQTDI